jgi:hypothetical protein
MGIWLSMPIAEVLTLSVSLPLMRRTLRRIRLVTSPSVASQK